jgi:hypothetical protein
MMTQTKKLAIQPALGAATSSSSCHSVMAKEDNERPYLSQAGGRCT